MARHRNYKEEYRRRIERGEARGLTRKEARGHAGDVTRRPIGPVVHHSPIYTSEGLARAYLSRLGANRRAKLVVVFDDGSRREIIGKKSGMKVGDVKKEWPKRLPDMKKKRSSYIEQFVRGNLPKGRSLIVGFQVIWS